jgi:hypothetical protein
LLFDPLGEFMTEQFRGWLRVGGAYQAWQPDAQGRFWSRALGVGFAAEHALPRVYNRGGRLIPSHGERRRMLAEERRLLAQREEDIARLQAELDRLRGERKSP